MRSLLLHGAVVLGVSAATAMASGCASGGDGVAGPIDGGGTVGHDGRAADSSADSSVSLDATPQDAYAVGDAGLETGDDDGGNSETSVSDAPADASGGAAPDVAVEDVSVEAARDAPADVEAAREASADAPADSEVAAEASADAPADVDAAPDASIDAPADVDVAETVVDAPADVVVADVADGGSCVTSPTTNYCSALPSMPADPVIDGVLDCGPALVPMTPEGWSGSGDLPAGNSASIAVAWRPTGLYVFVEVVTPVVIPADSMTPPFYGSGAEIYVESIAPSSATYDDPGAMQLVAAAPSGSMAVIGEGYRDAVDQGPWTPAEFGTYTTSTGFALEAFIVAGDLGLSTWTLASGDSLGLDIAINVSYPLASTMGAQGHRAGQYFLHVASSPIGAPYADPRSFCVPMAQ